MLKDELKPYTEESYLPQLNLFLVIDISGSMAGSKIQSVNDVMPQVMDMFDKISDENKDNFVIKVSVLTFNDRAEWMFPHPVYAKDIRNGWPTLIAEGGRDYGRMFDKLEEALHRKGDKRPGAHLNCMFGHKAPAIILMSDGQPLDSTWGQHFDVLKKNEWFRMASKIAIAIGAEDVDMEVLRKFVGGGIEAKVYTVHNIEQIKNAIKVVTPVACGHTQKDSSISPASTDFDFDDFD